MFILCWLLIAASVLWVAFILSVLLFIVVYDFGVRCLLLWLVVSGLARVSCYWFGLLLDFAVGYACRCYGVPWALAFG